MTSPPRAFTVSLVVAVADNGVIGNGGRLPWRLSSDLRRFRKLTMHHPLIMGRKTFESIGKPLDGRDSIVLTRSAMPAAESPKDGNLVFASSFEEALALAEVYARRRETEEIFVIGGADIFDQSMPLADRIYLTSVHGAPAGDTRWTVPSGPDWVEVWREDRPRGTGDEFPVTDCVLSRRRGA